MRKGKQITGTADTAKLKGTYQKCRHSNIVELATPPKDEPTPPGYLSAEAKAVWEEEVRRVVRVGTVEVDSSLLARYCEAEATFRVSVLAGEFPKIALLTELRRMAESLGIAGLRSRLGRTDQPKADAKPSPFTVRPR